MKTQAQVDKVMREMGAFVRPIRFCRENLFRHRERPLRNQLRQENRATSTPVTKVRLAGGVVKPGTNAAEDGGWFVRIDDNNPGAGFSLITVFRAAGGAAGDRVAEGTVLDSTADQTLAELNGSGLSFLVDVGIPTADDLTDNWRWFAFPDFIATKYLFDGTEADHGALSTAHDLARNTALQGCAAALSAWVTGLQTFLRTRWKTFWEIVDPQNQGFIDATLNEVSAATGVIEYQYTGLVEQGRDNMKDNTPTPQTIVQNVATASAIVEDGDNDGDAAAATPTLEEWAPAGRATAICVDDTVGQEEFDVALVREDDGTDLVALQRLRLKKKWSDPVLGVRDLTIVRGPIVVTGNYGAAGSWVIVGESESNTDKGTIFLRTVEDPSTPGQFRIDGYRDAAYLAADKVFTTAFGAASASLTIVGVGAGSALSGGTAKLPAVPVDGDTGNINLKTFRATNSNGVPDKLTWTQNVTSRGKLQGILADLISYRLHSAASGAETIEEDFWSWGTFPPFEVLDA
jgi:hypothetical protein